MSQVHLASRAAPFPLDALVWTTSWARVLGLLGEMERDGRITAEMRSPATGSTTCSCRPRSIRSAPSIAAASRAGARGSSMSAASLRCARPARRWRLGGIGSPTGSCAWFVLGCEHSLRQWAQREGWNGRPLNQHVATGILFGTLGVLVKHFGC
jgi:hypothetical protein